MKSFDESELKKLVLAKDSDLKEKIINKFSESREDRVKILGENQNNHTITTNTSSKPSKEKIINQALESHSQGNISEAASRAAS